MLKKVFTGLLVTLLLSGSGFCRKHPNDPDPLSKELTYAAEKGDIDEVVELLKKGANVNAVDRVGKSALSYAALNAHDKIVKILLEAGAGKKSQDSTFSVIIEGIELNQASTRDPSTYNRFEHILEMLKKAGFK